MGHIKKRTLKDGRTTYQARIPSPADRRKDVVKTFALKKDAERWLREQGSSMDRGEWIDYRRGDTPLRRVAEEWLETWGRLAPKTHDGYTSILNRHVLPAFGDTPVNRITPEAVQKFVNGLGEAHAANTVRRVLDVLRAVLRLAVERRYLSASPCDAISVGRRKRGIKIHPRTPEEIDRLVGQLPEHWRLPVLLTAYTGLRAGELWALRRDDVSLGATEISVDEAIKEVTTKAALTVPAEQRLTPSLIVGPTKTDAQRKISIPAFLRPLLIEHLERPLSGPGPDSFIFTTPTGEAVRHNLFYKRTFVPAVRAALGDRPFRFHDLRHTCATWLIQKGAHPLQIKLRMGHESIRTTMDIYGHLFDSAEPELAALLDRAPATDADGPIPIRRTQTDAG